MSDVLNLAPREKADIEVFLGEGGLIVGKFIF